MAKAVRAKMQILNVARIANVEQRKGLVKTKESTIFDGIENGQFHCLRMHYVFAEVLLTRVLNKLWTLCEK